MDNKTNLIYNGDVKYGADGWRVNGSTFTIDQTQGTNGSYGSLVFSGSAAFQTTCSTHKIPINTGQTYLMSADVKKDNISGSSNNLFCIMSYNKYGVNIGPADVMHTGNTTLARDLKDGDTVVYLTSVAGWWTTQTYRRIGICESRAFGYERHIYSQYYDSSTVDTTNNTITLRPGQTWTGGTWSAGTKVACFTDGSTYIYPISVSKSDADTWHHKAGNTWPKSGPTDNGWRMGTDYIIPGMICYKDNAFRITNWSLENKDSYQTRAAKSGEGANSIKKTGVVENSNNLETSSMKVRYIRDWLSGSTANGANHWCEISAWDIYGRNVAFASNGSGITAGGAVQSMGISKGAPNCSENTRYPKFHEITYTTGQTPASYPYLQGGSRPSAVQIDLGYVHELTSIQVWHYYADARTYFGTKVQVSTDLVNWTTVFDSEVSGRYAETSAGKTINLGEFTSMSMTSGGEYHSNRFYEI